jgi:histidine triad (HIT) family protein
MASLFSRIASGDIPSFKIAEDENFFAFLDIAPLALGHILVIPKKEIDYIFDMDEEMHRDFWQFAMRVAKAMKQVIPCLRVGVAVIGLEVPHAHIHLVPLNSMDDINFSRAKLHFPSEEMARVAKEISQYIQ